MNQKLKATLITGGLAVWCMAVATGLQFASKYITVAQLSLGLMCIGIVFCFYGIYSLVLTKLEFDAKISDLVDRK